jgi:integrase
MHDLKTGNDVDLNWEIVRFPRAKAGLSYRVPLNDVALTALTKLRERLHGTGPVIRKPSRLERHSCRKWFEKSLKKAAIADFCWHDLRHAFASRLRRAGVAIDDIADLPDHKIPGFTDGETDTLTRTWKNSVARSLAY